MLQQQKANIKYCARFVVTEKVLGEKKRHRNCLLQKLHSDYGNKIKENYERVMKVVENWGNKAVQAMAREAADTRYPSDLQLKQQRIRALCDAAQMLDFPCSLEDITASTKRLEDLQKELLDCSAQ